MSLPPSLLTRINEIAGDNISGATAVAQRAASLFLQLVDPQLDVPDTEIFSSLEDLSYALARAQPTMAPVLNLSNKVLQAMGDNGPRSEDLKPRIRGLAGTMMNQLDTSMARIALHAEQLLDDGAVVLTHSNSAAVKKTILNAKDSGKTLSVICTESRPMREGLELARDLAHHGVHVTFISDAAAASLVREATVIMVGADSVSQRGLVNKIGTRGLALAAREEGIPLFVLCGSQKFIPEAFVVIEKTKSEDELLTDPVPNLSVRNVYFDTTPLEYLRGVVTEEGLHSLEALVAALKTIETHFALNVDVLGPPFTSGR